MPRGQSSSSASDSNNSERGGSNNRGGGSGSGRGGRRKHASDPESKGSGSGGGSAKSDRPGSIQHSAGSANLGSDSTGSGFAGNSSTASSSSVKTYVDNAANRKLGRVGQPYGRESTVNPAGSSGNPSADSLSTGCSTNVKTYADTPQNRKLGRVGQPHTRNESAHSSLSTGSGSNPSSSSKVTDSVKTYVDNAENRKLGRVGQPYNGSESSQSFSLSTDSGYGSSFGSLPTDTNSSVKTYVDSPKNRQLGRVGQPYGSSSGSLPTDTNSSVKTYVDNQENRQLGRVGRPYGSSSGSLPTDTNSSVKTYVDSPKNRQLGRVGQPYGSSSGSLPTDTDSSVKTYVDNPKNRQLGRVGQPYGSSSGSLPTDTNCSVKTYVDNPKNRQLGRVGQPYGSSSDSLPTDTNSSVKTYVDNPKNRQLDRVGQPYSENLSQSFSHSTDSGMTQSYESLPTGVDAGVKTYVDNPHNRKLDRVGQPYTKSGLSQTYSSLDKYSDSSAPVCKSETARIQGSSKQSSPKPEVPNATYASRNSDIRVYKDCPLNRRLDRVGKPLGTRMYTRKGNMTSKVYANSAFNRFMGRVGKPLGSQPVSKKSKATKKKQEIIKSILDDEWTDSLHFDGQMDKLQFDAKHTYDTRHADLEKSAMREAIYQINRIIEEVQWKISSKAEEKPTTEKSVLTNFTGQIIDFKEIKKGKQIGRGGFGDVFFASWKGTAVAVKTLHKQTISQDRLRRFTEEIQTFSSLNHPNIVKFIGACVETPNLAIVMEYMQTSLFDEIHINDSDLSEEDRLSILRETSSGLQYLHGKKIAHCDMKSQNVLLDIDTEGTSSMKIADFGLSMIKSDAETSEERVQNVGTARYSAPEVLRGNELSAKDMMKADIYSLGLLVYEVLFQIEPFDDFTATQLQEQVGRKGKLPYIPDDKLVTDDVVKLMNWCLSKDPSNRPEINDISSFFEDISRLYI